MIGHSIYHRKTNPRINFEPALTTYAYGFAVMRLVQPFSLATYGNGIWEMAYQVMVF